MKNILVRMGFLSIVGSAILGAAFFLSPPAATQSKIAQVIKSDQRISSKGTKKLQFAPPKATKFKTPPDQPPLKKVKPLSEQVFLNPPVDPSARSEEIRPMNEATKIKIKPETRSENIAPGDFIAYRNTALAAAPVVSGATLNNFIPIEPSAANNGRVVFYTTNSYNAISGDGGQTFNYINPFDYFPADGTNDPIDGGFGGDQYVLFERTRGLMFWLLQYGNNGTTNRQRLCISRSQNDIINGACPNFFDFSPVDFNIPTPAGAGGTWLDFPDMAVSDGFLYLSSNVFCTSGCPGSQSIGAVAWRIPLAQLAQNGGIDFNFYYEPVLQTFRFAQGAHGTMYWGSHVTTALLRIYSWADNSGNIILDDVSHAAYNLPTPCVPPNTPPACGIYVANSPDGTNFAARADSRIQAAWVAGGVIGFMWHASQGGAFPFPHVQVLRFNEGSRTLLSQGQIFSNTNAYMYPSVQVNARGHLGGTMSWGGGAFFPNSLAWIADDLNGNTITPLENLTFAVGSAGPNETNFGGIYNRWGDYQATRMHSVYENTWIGTSFVIQAPPPPPAPPSGNIREPRFVWFGRERDAPPATNTIYVDRTNISGFENGTQTHPYNTVAEASLAASPGDTIIIRAGIYFESVTFDKSVTVRNEGGTVQIISP